MEKDIVTIDQNLCILCGTCVDIFPGVLKKELLILIEHDVMLSFMIGYPDITFLRVPSRKQARAVYL